MDEDEDYFSQEGFEEPESEEENLSDVMWGTYAYAPFMYDIEDMSMLDIPMYSTTHYNSAMYYQKEMAIGMGAWIKKPMWDSQVPYFDALHEYWTGEMLDYLASIRGNQEPTGERGIPVTRNNMCTRRKANERNEI
jgi:hypothetical protein